MKPCIYGHTTGRYKNGNCKTCQTARARLAYKENPAYKKRVNTRSKKWYQENKDKAKTRAKVQRITHASEIAEYMREYRWTPQNWPRLRCQQLRHKAKELDVPFDLKPEDIVVPSVCPFTLLPFDFGRDKKGAPRNQSPSVDRIKPDLGYVRGNVRVISMQANVAKNNITDPEIFRRLYEDALVWSLV